VQFTITDGSATNGSVDFLEPTPGAVTWGTSDFAPKVVSFPVTPDAAIEGDETFMVTLSNPGNIDLGAATSATVTIEDDDSAGVLTFSAASFDTNESDGSVTITVNRTGGSTGSASVDYSTAPGTATGADFTPVSGTLEWADGDSEPKTFVIPIADDGFAEPAESFEVTLSGATGAALGAQAEATVTIAESFARPVSIPTASTTMLLALAAALAAGALLMLRK
jgi:hypothetical protein